MIGHHVILLLLAILALSSETLLSWYLARWKRVLRTRLVLGHNWKVLIQS